MIPMLIAAKATMVFALTAYPVQEVGVNLQQNMITAMETVAHTATLGKQLESLTKNPNFIWSKLQTNVNVDNLSKYQDYNYYKSNPCFSSKGCSATQWSQVNNTSETNGYAMKKQINDKIVAFLNQHKDGLNTDTSNTKDVQRQSASSTGVQHAIGNTNQFASQQTNQLMQIRTLLMMQLNAHAAQVAIDNDSRARQFGADTLFRTCNFKHSSKRNWSFDMLMQ